MQKVLKSYLRRLSNLSGNNRSLLLLRLISDQFIDIHDLDFAEGTPSFDIIKGLMEHKKQIPLCSEVDSRSKIPNELSRRLKKIQRIEQFIFQERGAKDLYIGWPFIKGKFADDTPVRCPLLFFPVSIEKKKNTWYLSRREGVNITLNKTFLLAYAYYNDVKLDEELIETVIDDYDKDDRVFRTQLYELLKQSGVEINFNQENFGDQLKSFNTYRKSQLESSEKTGVLKMYPEAVMGIFPQSGSYLVPDYMKLLEASRFADLEEFFIQRTQQDAEQLTPLSRTSEENTFTPFPLDAYQEKAIKEVKKGNSILVQGPPGTGKSQLISNLICDFVARGKNVLLVCQKRAALDVVYDRLKQKDIHDFVALVHDFKNDRKSIFEQINRQIEAVETNEKKNNSLDSIQLERSFTQASRRIDQLGEELQEFKEALFDESECGKSAKELYLVSNPDDFSFPMNLEYKAFHFHDLKEVLRKFKDYLLYHDKFEKRTHFWAKGPSFAGFKTADLIRLLEIIREIPTLNDTLKANSEALNIQPVDFETAEYFSTKIPEIDELLTSLDERVIFKVFKQLHEERPTKELNWLIQLERTMMACFKGVGLETSLKSSELGLIQEVLQANLNSKSSPWQWVKWTFSKEKSKLRIVLANNQLRNDKKGFNTLVNRVDNRLNFEHSVTSIKENSWLHNFPTDLRKIDVQDWFYWQKMGLNAFYVRESIRALHEYIPISNINQEAYLKGLKNLKQVVEEIPRQVTEWSSHVNVHQIRAVVLKKEDPERLEDLLRKDFDAICEYHGLKSSLSAEEHRVLDKINEHGPRTLHQALDLFKNSLCLAWIDHIESKYPILRSVSSGKLDGQVMELIEAMEVKRSTSKEILIMKARENTYRDLVYNRLKNRVTYRDLQHQVTKKRRIWPIRRVLNEFIDEVFTLLPCWMCSPESASAIFPMQEHFDLVIFDEASQCFAERGIPAMYRGKQLVIAGDSQQLQPNDLYRVRWDEDDDDTPELSIDSLLDLTK
ncbi:MAG: AAA domain-containing protein, partial [Bacteroidota bacterium]